MEAALAAFQGISPVLQERGIHLAFQRCEHLNRALILVRAVAEQQRYEIINVMPQPHAGGSFAVTAWISASPMRCIRPDCPYTKKKSRKIVPAVIPVSNPATFFCCRLCC